MNAQPNALLINSLVGEHVRRARKVQGISQKQLAKSLHILPRTLRKWELGQNGISIFNISRIARALGYAPSAFASQCLAPTELL